MPAPVYFDSSVFLSIFMGESSGPSIKQLLQELTRDKTKIYTSIITIQEVSVRAFRKGARPTDNSKLARIHGLTKEMALSAAKFEAQLIDRTPLKEREDNKRRKWDCFHIATALELGCRTFYATDEKMLKRKEHFGITGMDFSKPFPRTGSLFPE